MADLNQVEQAIYDAMMREALPDVADLLSGSEGQEIARTVAVAVRGPVLAEAAATIADLVVERQAAQKERS